MPAYPPRKNRKWERLARIVEDCSPTILMTTEEIRSSLDDVCITVLVADAIGEPEGVSPRTHHDSHDVRGLTPLGSPKQEPELSSTRRHFNFVVTARISSNQPPEVAGCRRRSGSVSQHSSMGLW